MRRFDNRTVIVTNGARGMGASHVHGFVVEGHGRPQLDGIGFREFVDFMRRPGGSMSGLLRWQHFQGWSTVTIDGDRATARTPHIHTHTGVRRTVRAGTSFRPDVRRRAGASP